MAKRQNIRCTGDNIPFLNDIKESDKPDYKDLDDEQLAYLFKDLVNEKAIEAPVTIDELPDELRFDQVFAEDYYRMLFPGFEDLAYSIMVECDKKRALEIVKID